MKHLRPNPHIRRRFFVPVVALLLGATLGYMGCWLYFQKTVGQATTVVLDSLGSSLYAYEIEEAEKQFSSANRDVAIYTLDRAVRHLNSFQEPRYGTCRRTAYNLGRYNVRLATLYDEKHNQQARDDHLKKAVTSYKSMGWKLKDIEELRNAIPLIESGKLAEALKQYGELVTPCDMK